MNRLAEERLLLIRDLEKVLHYNEQQLQVKEEQLQNLIQSRSYKLGNLIIHNTKRTLFVLKRPKLLLKAPRKIYRKLSLNFHPLLEMRKALLRPLRNKARAKNNYHNPKRALVYVVYADGKNFKNTKSSSWKHLLNCPTRLLLWSMVLSFQKIRRFWKLMVA